MNIRMGKMVLIVENNYMSIFLFAKYLSREKVNYLTAEDGIKALSLCKEYTDIGLVLMDVELPKMNGIEVTQRIKKFRKDLPVVLHSPYSMYNNVVEKFGCDEFILGALNKEIIIYLLKKYIKDRTLIYD